MYQKIDYTNIGSDANEPRATTKRGTPFVTIACAAKLPEDAYQEKTWQRFDEMFTEWLASRSTFGVIWRVRPTTGYKDNGKKFMIRCRVAWEEEESIEKGGLHWEKVTSEKIKATVSAH